MRAILLKFINYFSLKHITKIKWLTSFLLLFCSVKASTDFGREIVTICIFKRLFGVVYIIDIVERKLDEKIS